MGERCLEVLLNAENKQPNQPQIINPPILLNEHNSGIQTKKGETNDENLGLESAKTSAEDKVQNYWWLYKIWVSLIKV